MIEPERRRAVLRGIWFVAVLVVIVGSLLPAASLPMQMLGHLDISDKLEHFGAYALLAFLPAIHERWKVLIALALGAIALGIGLEYGQNYSPGRDFEVADMIADAIGVCAGLLIGIPARSSGAVHSLLGVGRAAYSSSRR